MCAYTDKCLKCAGDHWYGALACAALACAALACACAALARKGLLCCERADARGCERMPDRTSEGRHFGVMGPL